MKFEKEHCQFFDSLSDLKMAYSLIYGPLNDL